MDIREVFARNLRKARNVRGLSQEALAHDAGIDRTYISALERGVYSATIVMVDKLATALGVEPGTLLQRPAKGRLRRSRAVRNDREP
jgi:transcriptional regulator with XRE-family HTH domain